MLDDPLYKISLFVSTTNAFKLQKEDWNKLLWEKEKRKKKIWKKKEKTVI